VSLSDDETGLLKATIIRGGEELGFSVTEEQADAFARIAAWLAEWNRRMNLTAVRGPEDIAVKHILDSMTCLAAAPFPVDSRVLDVGTGAVFPGVALKVMRPDLRMAFLDSTRKKLDFVEFVTREMGWSDTEILCGRAEELGHDPVHREAYEVVVARAVAALRILVEFTLPFAQVGGVFLAMKGPGVTEELGPALAAIRRLGGEAGEPAAFSLPLDGGERAVLPIRKVSPTPADLPRIYREIKRKPL
jgi:16S rRNA (guanine527-N7)-methyltransferase